MKIYGETKNQHYVPQVEQRLNSLNPDAPKKKQRIFSFNVVDREEYGVALLSDKGALIEGNLSLGDLFSFDVVDKKIRANFESLFHDYEHSIEINTCSLLTKLQAGSSNIKDELLNLFASKLLNFFRNPHCIEKAINTVSGLAELYPLDPDLASICARIETGRKPHQEYLCSQLGITNDTYKKWLKILFMLLMRPKPNEPNMLEAVIKSLYENESHFVSAFVFNYTGEHADKRPLLSDRGFSLPIQEEGRLAYTFNLSSNAFIGYTFTDVDKQSFVSASDRTIELFKKQPKNVSVKYVENELNALASYNKNTIYQAKEKVYCSSKHIYGL
ncbi:hypothetical protein [Pseudomonas sp. LB3P14]